MVMRVTRRSNPLTLGEYYGKIHCYRTTKENVGHPIAMGLDDVPISAPNVDEGNEEE
jgi:preprotein translocase subunit SecD